MIHHLSFAHGAHLDYIEGLYDSFKKDPKSVEGSWRSFFEGYDFALAQNRLATKITPNNGPIVKGDGGGFQGPNERESRDCRLETPTTQYLRKTVQLSIKNH